MPVEISDLVSEMLRLSSLLDEANDRLVAETRRWAEAEHDYRRARAKAYLQAEGPVAERESTALLKTGDLSMISHLAEGLKVAALEKVRSVRAQLSATQSVANAVKTEIELARTGPGA